MMIAEALSLPLFQRALVAGILVSVACGIVGTYVVVKRMSSISGGLSHAAFGGVGLGYLLGFSPLIGALGFCLVSVLGIVYVYRTSQDSLDTLISIFWSLGMALGILFVAFSPGYAPDLSIYLFGSIVFVPEDYLLFALLLDIAVLCVVLFFSRSLQAIAFDEEFAEVRGLPVNFLLSLLLIMTAVTVVTLIRVAGVILTIALLTTPAVIARQCGQAWRSQSLVRMMALSTFFSVLSITLGLFLAFWLSSRFGVDAPTGPLIIVVVTTFYLISSIFLRVFRNEEL